MALEDALGGKECQGCLVDSWCQSRGLRSVVKVEASPSVAVRFFCLLVGDADGSQGLGSVGFCFVRCCLVCFYLLSLSGAESSTGSRNHGSLEDPGEG